MKNIRVRVLDYSCDPTPKVWCNVFIFSLSGKCFLKILEERIPNHSYISAILRPNLTFL